MSSTLTYVFELPTRIVLDLGMILDSGDVWEDVAITMPDIADIDIDDCRRLRDSRDGRPTEALLRIWGSKGYTINDLYKVFARLKMIRCMKIIKEFVEPDLHMLETDCLSLPDVITSPKGNSTEGSSYVKPSTQQTHPSVSVYSKKTEGSSWYSLGDVETELSSGGGSVLNDLQNTLAVKYQEILEATHNFAVENILGRGGYGTVYKGQWKHLFVAVKRIQSKKDSGAANEKERLRQSLQELRTLAKFRHDNILSLYGYSLDGPEPCLVYQYMANGSLEDRLLCRKGSSPLAWATRFQISQGVSCGLHFLHSIGKAPMIHGDVKSANILLDKHMEPKLGDFGLCRDGQQEVGVDERAPLIASHIKGTLAYLPPEFITHKILTTKLDVYSFGVVLLEIATGLRAYSDSRTPPGLVDYISKLVKENQEEGPQKIAQVCCDKKLVQDFKPETFASFVDLALMCSHKDRLTRPSFYDALLTFNEISAAAAAAAAASTQ